MSEEMEESKGVTEAQATQLADDGIGGFFEAGDKKRGLFFQIFDGSICLKSKALIEGWEGPVETQHPKTKAKVFTYVKRFDSLVAKIVNMEKRRVEFDDGTKITNYNLTLIAGGKKAILQLTYMDNFLRKFLKVAPNIDFEKYIRMSAFKKHIKGKDKQLISIKQATTLSDQEVVDPFEWPAVPFYWQSKLGEDGKPDWSTKAKGADGTVCPSMDHDEEDDTWDSKEQNKFLIKHFTEHQLPTIKAIADRLGIKDYVEDDQDAPMFTGPNGNEPTIPVVTEKPSTFTYDNVKDAMTSGQSKELRALAKRVNGDVDKIAGKFCDGTDFDDLSIIGAAYMKYRLEKKIKKAQAEDPTAYPEPKDDSALKAELKRRQAEKNAAADDDDDDDDDDDWAPAKPKKKAPVEEDDDDDDDWTGK